MLTIKTIVTGPFQENTFIVKNDETGDALLFDPGENFEKINQALETMDAKPEAILCTHAHLDHVGAVAELQKKYGVSFYLQKSETPILNDFPKACVRWGLPKPQELPKVTNWLNGDENLQFQTADVEVLFTPGHSAGGCCYKIENHLFSGDTLFAGSIGRTDFPTGDHQTLLNSIRTKLLTMPDETEVHCGHGPDTTIGREWTDNPFLRESTVV